MNRTHVLGAAISGIVAGVAACVACSSINQTPTPAPVDAGADVLRDAPSDVRIDRDEPDASGGEWEWLPGEWTLPAGAPNFCELRSAVRPDRDIPPLQWKACASGRTGCRELVIDWHPGPGPRQYETEIDEPVRRLRNGEVILKYTRWYPDPAAPSTYDRSMEIIYTLDGAARAGYATDARSHGRPPGSQRCIGGLSGGNEDFVEYHVLDREKASVAAYSPWGSSPTLRSTREFSNTELGGYPGLLLSDDLHAYIYSSTQSSGRLALLDLGTERITTIPNGLELQGPRPVQDGAVALRFGAQFFLDFLSYDGSTTRLVSPEGTRSVAGFALDRSQGDSLVWVEADGISPATNTVLFASPPARNAAQVVRRRVTAYDNPDDLDASRMIANNGYALVLTGKKRALLVRLSDGAGWTIDAEPNTTFSKAMWVDDQDVWIATGIQPYLPRSEQVFEDGIVRFSRASLGSPNVAPK